MKQFRDDHGAKKDNDMAYISSIHETNYTVATEENGQQRQIVLDGAARQIDWRQIAPLAAEENGQTAQGGRYTLLIEGQSYEVFARQLNKPDETEGVTYELHIGDQRFEVHVENERERALIGSLKSARESGEIKVRAPMPGLVLNVVKAVGEKVERGETVAILEAMKMENDLSTPHEGTVKEVLVNKGQTVNQGDVLVVIAGE
jgi:biotin carboxyl carrier protein